MVVVELSKKAKVLYALITVVAYAIMISEGTAWFLNWMELQAMPDYTFWLVAGALVRTGPTFYSFLCGTDPSGREIVERVGCWD